jgi:hypothetical protein
MAGVAPRLRAELRPEQAKATSGRSKIQGPKIAAMIQLRFFAESCFIPEDGTVGSEIQAGASLAGNDSSDASSTGSTPEGRFSCPSLDRRVFPSAGRGIANNPKAPRW